tara:strand:- start:1 stop:273 length:273 start_codon:yes stop_codon:yes gene_type:complete
MVVFLNYRGIVEAKPPPGRVNVFANRLPPCSTVTATVCPETYGGETIVPPTAITLYNDPVVPSNTLTVVFDPCCTVKILLFIISYSIYEL